MVVIDGPSIHYVCCLFCFVVC